MASNSDTQAAATSTSVEEMAAARVRAAMGNAEYWKRTTVWLAGAVGRAAFQRGVRVIVAEERRKSRYTRMMPVSSSHTFTVVQYSQETRP